MTDCTHTDAAYSIIDEIKEWCENQTTRFGIMIPSDDWDHYDIKSLRDLLAGWLRDHCAALGHKSNPELQALADLVVREVDGKRVPGPLLEALETTLFVMASAMTRDNRLFTQQENKRLNGVAETITEARKLAGLEVPE